jgi:hypothetical protein
MSLATTVESARGLALVANDRIIYLFMILHFPVVQWYVRYVFTIIHSTLWKQDSVHRGAT